MSRRPALLSVHLLTSQAAPVRVGNLVRDGSGGVTFTVDEAYLRDPERPTLSLRWCDVSGDLATQERLAYRGDKIALYGQLPPWFEGLLPEGALRTLVEQEMGPGDHDHFDVLARLGGDLPGAVVIAPETNTDGDLGPIRLDRVQGLAVAQPEGTVKFSLAGVQLKFAATQAGDRLTIPARSGEGRFILKVPTARYPGLPEAEFTAMSLCRAVGIDTAQCELVSTANIEGVPDEFLSAGDYALSVRRFDRRDDGTRIHMEDLAQILGAVGERKYTMANTETVLHAITRFSALWKDDTLEGMRRVAADVLIGNGDNHLKNWSFLFPDGRRARLSPAYDIVPTVLYIPGDRLALRFVKSSEPLRIGLHKFSRAARYLQLSEAMVVGEISRFVESCLDVWPALLRDMPLPAQQARTLIDRMHRCRLVHEVRGLESPEGAPSTR